MQQLTSTVSAMTVCLVLLLTGSALAEDDRGESNASLKGTFRFSTVKTCTDTSTGSMFHFYFSGTILYDGNGSAQLTQRGTSVLPGSPPTSFEETAVLTYLVKPNGSFTQEGTFVAADRSYTLTGAKMTGQIDVQRSVLTLSAAIPSEKETMTIPGKGGSEYFCGASGTGVRMR
jgi:hypothetical protein